MSIRKRNKRSYQVRVTPFPAKTLPTREAAERYELELLLRRSQGDRFVEPSRTLGEEIDAWLKRWKATRRHSPRTLEFNERCSKVWRRIGNLPVSSLRRVAVEDLAPRGRRCIRSRQRTSSSS